MAHSGTPDKNKAADRLRSSARESLYVPPGRGYKQVACCGLDTWEERSCIHRAETVPGPLLPEHFADLHNINPTFISCTDYWDLCQPTLR